MLAMVKPYNVVEVREETRKEAREEAHLELLKRMFFKGRIDSSDVSSELKDMGYSFERANSITTAWIEEKKALKSSTFFI